MKWVIGAVLGVALLAGVAITLVDRTEPATRPNAASDRPELVSEIEAVAPLARLEQSLDAVPGSRREIAQLPMPSGRVLNLHLVETEDGSSCLINEDSSRGLGAVCSVGEVFAERPVLFSIDSDGGPERFRDMYLSGVAAPSISAVVLIKSNGTRVRRELAANRAFVFQSSPDELARDILPAGLRLYGKDGRPVETIRFPSLR